MRDYSNLKVYTESGDEIGLTRYKFKKPIGYGCGGKAYKYRCGKVIKLLTDIGTPEQYDLMQEIKNLKLNGIYKLENILSSDRYLIKCYAGSISKYYKSKNKDLWMLPSSYVVKEINKLRNTASELAKRKIAIVDLNIGNVLITNEGLIIIDTDDYDRSIDDCEDYNLFRIKRTIDEVLDSQYFEHFRVENHNEFEVQHALTFNDFTDESFQRRLLKHKRPIDWFYKEN